MGSCSSTPSDRGSIYAASSNPAAPHGGATNGSGCPAGFKMSSNAAYVTSFNANPKITAGELLEHYQPYEFPICPVINSWTQELVRTSWAKILSTEFDSKDTQSGKMSGASYFYNSFFDQLFTRLKDFERIFPDIKSRADIMSKVMALCMSIRVEEIELAKFRLSALGQKHVNIVHDPWLFGIYATTIHSTVRSCLGDDATPDVMSAWLHLLSFVLRNMLPEYFAAREFKRFYEGATNAAAAMNEKHQEEIRDISEVKSLRRAMEKSRGGTEPQSRLDTKMKLERIENYKENMKREDSQSRTMLANGSPILAPAVAYGTVTMPPRAQSSTVNDRELSNVDDDMNDTPTPISRNEQQQWTLPNKPMSSSAQSNNGEGGENSVNSKPGVTFKQSSKRIGVNAQILSEKQTMKIAEPSS